MLPHFLFQKADKRPPRPVPCYGGSATRGNPREPAKSCGLVSHYEGWAAEGRQWATAQAAFRSGSPELGRGGLVLLLLFALFFPTPRAPAQTPPPSAAPPLLTYIVQPVFDGKSLLLDIDLSFAGNADGTDTLHVPNRFAGLDALDHAILHLAALSPSTRLGDGSTPATRTLTYPPGQIVHLHYQVRQEHTGPLDGPEAYFRPLLNHTYFHFLGAGVWIYPGPANVPHTISLAWKNWPVNWTLACSFGIGPDPKPFTATPYQFQEAVFVGGDFRLLPLAVRGKPVTVALRGHWPFPDEHFAQLAAHILEQERAFWQDDDFPPYLITLLPLETSPAEAADSGGLELTNSVALFQPNRDKGEDALRYVLAHELFHAWNADKISASGPASAWFSEGVTDYYTRLLLLRGGLMSLDDYVKAWNKTLSDYVLAPASRMPQSKVAALFFADPDVCKTPYRQGALLAANWNSDLRRATQDRVSLDDILRDLLASSRALGENAPSSASLLPALIQKRGGPDITPDLLSVVQSGGLATPDPQALGPGYTLQTRRIPTYELGFDADALLRDKTIAGLKPGSAAEQAGLRDGLRVLGYDRIVFGDPNQRIDLTIQDITGTHEVSFYPQGARIAVPQYVPVKGVDSARTRAWFGLPASAH